MDVLDWIDKAKNFNTNEFLNDFVFDIIEDQEILEIQLEQWDDGKDNKARIIGFYSKTTELITGGTKKAGDPWNLRNTGDFWRKTYLGTAVKGNDIEFEFNSDGIHKDELFETIENHGDISSPEDIFGLAEYKKIKFAGKLEPKFVNQLNKYYV